MRSLKHLCFKDIVVYIKKGDFETKSPFGGFKIEIIVVDPYISEDVESVEVKIVNASDGTVVYSGAHSKSEFPFSKQVKGSTPTVFQLYIDGKFCGEETKFQ